MAGNEWTDSEVEILKTIWPTEASCVSIGKQLDRTWSAVSSKAKRCGLKPRHQQVIWKDQSVVETLKRLWLAGLSSTEICVQEGWSFSRGAILGKLHRLGLLGKRPKVYRRPVNKPRKSRADRIRPVTIFTMPVESIADPVHEDRINLENLMPWHCRYPFGENSPYTYCGRPKQFGSYCLSHSRRCYREG